MARVGSIVACGGSLDGKKYLSIETLDNALKEQIYGTDLVLGPIRWGLGWGLPSKEVSYIPNWATRRACRWGGWGGSALLMDLDAKVCSAYAMNKMITVSTEVSRAEKLHPALYECIGEQLK
jgi:hypothetical protein